MEVKGTKSPKNDKNEESKAYITYKNETYGYGLSFRQKIKIIELLHDINHHELQILDLRSKIEYVKKDKTSTDTIQTKAKKGE